MRYIKSKQLSWIQKTSSFIRNSQHVPFEEYELMDAMETHFDLLYNESDPFVQAVLGHHLFGYIHPYMYGNGRIARFIIRWNKLDYNKS